MGRHLLCRLYVFDGFVYQDGSKFPLDEKNLLLRGCTLRKTEWAIGVAVNVGWDSKIVQNMTKAPRKITQLEKHMNILVFIMFALLFAASCLLAGLNIAWEKSHLPAQAWYLTTNFNYPELYPNGFGWFIGVR
eukprot:jgi/Chrzof1/8770/Cz03g23250.t1